MTNTTWPEDPTGVAASGRSAKVRAKVVEEQKAGAIGQRLQSATSVEFEGSEADTVVESAGYVFPAPTPDEPETDSEGQAMVAALMDRMIDEHLAKWDALSARIAAITADVLR